MTSFNLIEWLSIWEDAMWPVTLLFTDADIVFKVCIDSCGRIDISFQLMGLPLPWSWKWLNHFPTYSFPTMNWTLFPLKQACLRNCIPYIFRYPEEMLQLCSSPLDVIFFLHSRNNNISSPFYVHECILFADRSHLLPAQASKGKTKRWDLYDHCIFHVL